MAGTKTDGQAVRVQCGNCGRAFWCHDLIAVGDLAIELHDHWTVSHGTTNVHGPRVTVFAPVADSHENLT